MAWVVEDLTGRVFGKLTVIERSTNHMDGGSRWKCVCECGNIVNIPRRFLLSGHTKSCGCYQRQVMSERSLKDLTNMKFGRLLVIRRHGSDRFKQATWMCKCDCGADKVVSTHHLLDGHTKSCGCLKKDMMRKPHNEASINCLYGTYRRSAKARELIFSLDKDEFKDLIFGNCHYCGLPPMRKQNKEFYGSILYNGIDRIDNDLGYVTGNVVSCCAQCNRAKLNYTVDEFKSWIKRTYEYMDLARASI